MGSNGKFSDGFLMGAIAGGALVFLIGTKRGNQVLKIIMEEGRASIGDLMDEIDEYKEEMNEAQIEEVEEVNHVVKKEATSVNEKTREPAKVDVDKKTKTPGSRSSKRFFKKSK